MYLSEFLPKETLDERELYLELMHKYQLIFTPGENMKSERAGYF